MQAALWITGLLALLGGGAAAVGGSRLPNRAWTVAFVVGFVAAGGFVVLAVANKTAKEHAEFMEDCLQHRPRYECTLLWRGARKDGGPDVVPIPIPVR